MLVHPRPKGNLPSLLWHHRRSLRDKIRTAIAQSGAFLRGDPLQRRSFVLLVGIRRPPIFCGSHEYKFHGPHLIRNFRSKPAAIFSLAPSYLRERRATRIVVFQIRSRVSCRKVVAQEWRAHSWSPRFSLHHPSTQKYSPREPHREGKFFSWLASLLTSDWHRKDIVGIGQGLVASGAFAGEITVFSIRL